MSQQPTAFDTQGLEKNAIENIQGIEVTRYGCVTVAEELAIIDLAERFAEASGVRDDIEWNLELALIVLRRGLPEIQKDDLNQYGMPAVVALAKFLLAERSQHKPAFADEPQGADSPKGGTTTEPDSSPPMTDSATPSEEPTQQTKRGAGKTSRKTQSAA